MLAFLVVFLFVFAIVSLVRLIRAAIRKDSIARRQYRMAFWISLLLFFITFAVYVASVVREYLPLRNAEAVSTESTMPADGNTSPGLTSTQEAGEESIADEGTASEDAGASISAEASLAADTAK